jgi:hypothetical protein
MGLKITILSLQNSLYKNNIKIKMRVYFRDAILKDNLDQKLDFDTGYFEGVRKVKGKYNVELNEIFHVPLFIKKLLQIFETIP